MFTASVPHVDTTRFAQASWAPRRQARHRRETALPNGFPNRLTSRCQMGDHLGDMRTTLTVDDAVDRELRKMAGRSGASYRETVNRALRAGLNALHTPVAPKPYRLKPHRLGRLAGVDYDKVGQAADEWEDLRQARDSHAAD